MNTEFSNAFVKNPPFPNNYSREFLCFDRGEGSFLVDIQGKRYLDFAGGIAVNSLGYGNEGIIQAAAEQVAKLTHVSNLYTTRPTVEFAQAVTASSPLAKDQPWQADKHPGYFEEVHFGNSGTEANEAALKYAKMYAGRKQTPNGPKILACTNGFHGRTLGALSVTYAPKYRKPYEPLIGGVEFIDFNDVKALESTLSTEFTAVIVEPVQGEGGLECMTQEFARSLNSLCRKFDVILIADEVQTGIGRTGTLFASQWVGLEPDIITLSKPIAGGLPLSATLLPKKINELVQVGDHGTTFGGGPVTTRVALEVWRQITAPGFLSGVGQRTAFLQSQLEALVQALPSRLGSLKGAGMLRGIQVKDPDMLPGIISGARDAGLLILRSGTDIIRLAPPLTITTEDITNGIEILRKVLEEV